MRLALVPLLAWVGLGADGLSSSAYGPDEAFRALLNEALTADPDAGGLLAFNNLAGEPVTQLSEGRPLVLRTPESRLTLGNFMRAQVFGAFAALSLGMRVLADEGVHLDVMVAHGGLFRTEGVAQRLLGGTAHPRGRGPRRR